MIKTKVSGGLIKLLVLLLILSLPLSACGDAAENNSSSTASGGTDVLDWEDDEFNNSNGAGAAQSQGAAGGSSKSGGSIAVVSNTGLKGKTIRIGSLTFDKRFLESTVSGRDRLKQVAAIEKAYGCKIELVEISDYTSVKTSIIAGKPVVDIMNGGGPHLIAGYMQGAMLQPLDNLGIDFQDARWNKSVTDAMTFGGKHYGVMPVAQGMEAVDLNLVMYYNKSLLKRAGINDDLYVLQKNGLWTWEKFEEICLKVVKQTQQVGFAENYCVGYSGLLASNSADWIVNKNGKLLFEPDSPKAMQVLEFYKKMYDSGAMRMNDPKNNRKRDESDFYSGKVAFMVDYLERIRRGYPSMADDFGVLYVPKAPGASDYQSQYNWFYYYSIPAGAKDPKDLAVILNEFCKKLYTDARNREIIETEILQYVRDKGSLETIMGLGDKSYLSESMKAPFKYDVDNTTNTYGWFIHMYNIVTGRSPQTALSEE